MRIFFVADGRSPIARSWLHYWPQQGHEVFLLSTAPADPLPGLAGFAVVPVALSGLGRGRRRAGGRRSAPGGARLIGVRKALRHWAGPLTVVAAAREMRRLVAAWRPDLVHALRIPFEGMLAAEALRNLDIPLLLSVWGNDFTLHAPANPLMARATRRALQRADALHADCQRDVHLARRWGWPAGRPSVVLPGNGGLDLNVFHPSDVAPEQPVVVNPRGFRAYVRNDTFFQAIPLVLAQRPETRFVCVAMQGEAAATSWLERLQIAHAVELLPYMTRPQLAAIFRQAQVTVSPSEHDGTPNSLLESMACGCVPVAGDLASIREWIEHGRNGLLVDPGDPRALAEAILKALNDAAWRQAATAANWDMLQKRAEYHACMAQAEAFYRRLIEKTTR